MKVLSSKPIKTFLPRDVYVGYYKPATFNVDGWIEIRRYLHKLLIAKSYDDDNLFKLRMDAVRTFGFHSELWGEDINIEDVSLKYTTVWAFQLMRYRVELADGKKATVDRKEYNLLSGSDHEYMYDEILGLKGATK